jgi:hypothetical protein
MIIALEKLTDEQLIVHLYDNEDAYEAMIGSLVSFSNHLIASYGQRAVRSSILYSCLIRSTLPDDHDVTTARFDFAGDDSIAQFVRTLARDYLPRESP